MKLYLKLEEEIQELNKKIDKLKTFINSSDFNKIAEESQSLLLIQYDAMKTYRGCLVSRLYFIMKRSINE